MTRLLAITLLALGAAAAVTHQAPLAAQEAPAVTFTTVDIVIDTNGKPLAVYQVDFRATAGDVRIVSVEGGAVDAFRDPPHYDPRAIQHERAILAAYNTADADKLPTGRITVATLHLQVSGDVQPEYEIRLDACASVDGQNIPATVSLQSKGNPQ